ncbi:hypothetical protein [Planococcus salinus]|nr:hypothetical protein [Planococcus salinus]
MIQQLEETFADFPTDEAAWDQQAIQEFIDRNHESIKEMVNSAEQRKDFFQQGPLTPPLK